MKRLFILMIFFWVGCSQKDKNETTNVFVLKKIPSNIEETIKKNITHYLRDTLLYPETLKDFEYRGLDSLFTTLWDDSMYLINLDTFLTAKDSFDILMDRIEETEPIFRSNITYVADTLLLEKQYLKMIRADSIMKTIASNYKKEFLGWYVNVGFAVNNIYKRETIAWVTFCFDSTYSNIMRFYKKFKSFEDSHYYDHSTITMEAANRGLDLAINQRLK